MHNDPVIGKLAPATPRADAVHASAPVARTRSAPVGTRVAKGMDAATTKQDDAATSKRVDAAIDEANKSMNANNVKLQFKVDPDTKMTVIEIVDTANDTVLRQIPAQEMLDIAKQLDRMQGVLLRQKA